MSSTADRTLQSTRVFLALRSRVAPRVAPPFRRSLRRTKTSGVEEDESLKPFFLCLTLLPLSQPFFTCLKFSSF
jgi:hypothetical protein